jgi:hypothetical protein
MPGMPPPLGLGVTPQLLSQPVMVLISGPWACSICPASV